MRAPGKRCGRYHPLPAGRQCQAAALPGRFAREPSDRSVTPLRRALLEGACAANSARRSPAHWQVCSGYFGYGGVSFAFQMIGPQAPHPVTAGLHGMLA